MGTVHVALVEEAMVTPVQGLLVYVPPPIATVMPLIKFVPVSVKVGMVLAPTGRTFTEVAEALAAPGSVTAAVSVGAPLVLYVKAFDMEPVRPPTVTLTVTVPVPAGLEQVSVSGEPMATALQEADVDPNWTELFPSVLLKFVPLIVTEVPPPVGPKDGLTPVTVGALEV